MTDTALIIVLYIAIMAFTIVPWFIGLGWMAHHWFGV